MATKASLLNSGNGSFARQLLVARYEAYRRIAVRKHGLPSDFLHPNVQSLSNEELSLIVENLRDLAHLPPE